MIPWGTLLQQEVIHQIRHLQMAYLFIYITDITHSITIPLRAYICHSFAKCIIITNPWNTHLWGEWVMNWKLGTSSNKTKKRKKSVFWEDRNRIISIAEMRNLALTCSLSSLGADRESPCLFVLITVLEACC